jgi:N-acetylglucosamine repressor
MRLPHEHLIAQRMKAPLMRSVNGIGLLNLISEQGPISRASLAKLSRLSKPTVSSQIEALMRQGWVVEVGPGKAGSKGGKKPTLVRFNADAGRLFAAEINPEQVRVAAADLEGRIVDRSARALGSDLSAGKVVAVLRRELERVISLHPSHGIQREIAIAAPGRVDLRRGLVLEAGNLFTWQNVPVRATLEKAFSIPVFVDNNVKMATLGELHHGVARGQKDVVLVRLDTGIGSGVVIRGKLYHGNRFAAGEIAHMILDLAKAAEDWRIRGYLESMVGADRILSQAQATGIFCGSALEFLHTAKHATGESRRLYDRVVLHLGIAVANLICAYDPAVVVLQGELLAAIVDDLRMVVNSAVPWQTSVTVSEISGDAVLLGAIAAARAQAYERIARLINQVDRATDKGFNTAAIAVG